MPLPMGRNLAMRHPLTAISDWFSLHAYNLKKLGFRKWLRCEVQNVALALRLTTRTKV
jgi:hypothetical protein